MAAILSVKLFCGRHCELTCRSVMREAPYHTAPRTWMSRRDRRLPGRTSL